MFSKRRNYLLILFFYTIAFSIFMPDRQHFLEKLRLLLSEQTYLVHDFIEVAGLSVTFFNVAIHIFIVYLLLLRYGTREVNGLELAAVGTFIGHSFFGTHFLNVLPIILGGVAYARICKVNVSTTQPFILFATGTAPIVSYLALGSGHIFDNFLNSVFWGFLLGFLTIPLANHFYSFHKGFSLYNFGFTTGLISMISLLFLEYFGITYPPQKIVLSDFSIFPILYYLGIILLIFIYLLKVQPRFSSAGYKNLINEYKQGSNDFVELVGLNNTLYNLLINGIIYFFIVLIFSGKVTGPTLGGLLNLLDFSAYGKHFYNCYPISIGIIIGALLSKVSFNELQFQLSLLFGCGLAPIASRFGWGFGVIAGLLHFNLVLVTFILHKGLSLYNNGFSTVLVAAVLYPILEIFEEIFL